MFTMNEFNHSGSGDLSAEQSKLDTKSSTKISFEFDNVKYFENSELKDSKMIKVRELFSDEINFVKKVLAK